MKISSQLANNFDYCSAEFGVFFNKDSLLGALRASAVNIRNFLLSGSLSLEVFIEIVENDR